LRGRCLSINRTQSRDIYCKKGLKAGLKSIIKELKAGRSEYINPNMNLNETAFDDNVSPIPEKNVNSVLRNLELAAVVPTQAALGQTTIKATGEEVQKIMSKGFDDFKRQTGRNMTYSEMRYAYG
jgi:hypothetical protein